MEPTVVRFSSKQIALLRSQFEELSEVTAFDADTLFASKTASYGIFREIGTVNDELARFIFDNNTGQPIRVQSMKAEFVEWNGLFGLRIFSEDSQRLELRTKGFYDIIHPQFSKNPDGSLHSLYIFPQIIKKIAHSQGVELVLVKSWGKNSIFGGFDPAKGYYQTNFWEIENNDALKFAALVRDSKVAFMGTHDLIAHIAGIDRCHWELLKHNADRVYRAIDSYFKSVARPSISALILPYTLGVVLDDLAQPPSYSSKNHIAVLNELLSKISENEIPANLPTVLTRFPDSFEEIIKMSRVSGIENYPEKIRSVISRMTNEILRASLVKPA